MPPNDHHHDHHDLHDLRARAAIEELKAAYARRADAVFRTPGPASAVDLADLFTDDGVLDLGPFGRFEGRPALLDAFENILPLATRWSTHFIVSPTITVADDGKSATGHWYFIIKSVPQGPPQLIEILGSYADKYTRVAGHWRIRESISGFFVPPV